MTGSENVAVNGTIFKELPTNTGNTISCAGTGTTANIVYVIGLTANNQQGAFPVGHTVQIAGVTPTGYNGNWTVTASGTVNATAAWLNFATATSGAQTVAGTVLNISVGQSWASNFAAQDNTGENNPVGSNIGCEMDVYVNHPTGAATTDTNRQRVGINISLITNTLGDTYSHCAYGCWVTTQGNTIVDRAYSAMGNAAIGLDFANCVISNAAIALANTQSIAFDSINTTSDFTRSLSYQSGQGLTYQTASGNVLVINDSGNIINAGAHSIAANGYSWLPNGLLMQWGSYANANSTSNTISFPIDFPTTCFSVTVTGSATGITNASATNLPAVTATSTSTFAVITGNATHSTIRWMAVGN